MFESLLARRYISTQKRHSVLTVCSIAIAIALMTMLFTALSTLFGCMRDVAFDDSPFHIRFNSLTEEQAKTVAEIAGEYGTCYAEEATAKDGTYWTRLILDKNISSAYDLVEKVSKKAGLSQPYKNFVTNEDLLFLDMKDDWGRGIMAIYLSLFYVLALFIAATVRLVIDTAFEVSSKERERQFGVLQSIGATPKQIVRIITFEGLLLMCFGIPIGTLLGIGTAYVAFRAVVGTGFLDFSLSPEQISRLVNFHVNPWLLLMGVLTGALWVLLSAYGTGMRIIKKTPIQAISARSNSIKKVRKNSLFGMMFGWTGKLATRNNTRQPKRFIITVVSLTLSITLFASVSVAIKEFRKAVEEAYNTFGLYDYHIIFKGDETKFDYREPIRIAEESDVFKETAFEFSKWIYYVEDDPESNDGKKTTPFYVYYCNETSYNNHVFGGKPPISYQKLNEIGGYIFTGNDIDAIPETDSITLSQSKSMEITREEYEALSPEEQKNAFAFNIGYDPETDSYIEGDIFSYTKYTPHDYRITKKIPFDELENPFPDALFFGNIRILVTTLDVYESGEYLKYNPYEDDVYYSIQCNLADGKTYVDGNRFIEQNKDVFTSYGDNTEEIRKARATLSAIEIGAGFLNAMFVMIAVVNMVNILSTGILNRRGELASLQCVGMTERQLYKMTFVECLQYALGSGVAALILSEGLMFLTQRMLYVITVEEEVGKFINYLAPVPRVLIAAVAAFGVALVASLIPLRGMRSKSLVEHVHSVE